MSLGVTLSTTAAKLLATYGDNVTFTHVVPGSFVPATGALGSSTTTTYGAQGVSSQFTQMELANSTIEYGDLKYLILPPSGAVPQIGDTVVIGAITYRVMSVLNDNLQGVTILYTLHLRV